MAKTLQDAQHASPCVGGAHSRALASDARTERLAGLSASFLREWLRQLDFDRNDRVQVQAVGPAEAIHMALIPTEATEPGTKIGASARRSRGAGSAAGRLGELAKRAGAKPRSPKGEK